MVGCLVFFVAIFKGPSFHSSDWFLNRTEKGIWRLHREENGALAEAHATLIKQS